MIKNKFLGSVLLISFTTIGAGALSLPLEIFNSGFFLGCFSLIFVWLFMLLAAFALLEVVLKSPKDSDLLTMTQKNLGSAGKFGMLISYLLLLYALICAYLKGTSSWVINFFAANFNVELPLIFCLFGTAALIGAVVCNSVKLTDFFNRVFTVFTISAFGYLIVTCFPNTDISQVKQLSSKWPMFSSLFPFLVTTFGFGIILPSIAIYLDYDAKKIKNAVVIGSLIPLGFYLLWSYTVLSVANVHGDFGLLALSLRQADSLEVATALENTLKNSFITFAAKAFSLCAILTSLFGVSLSLYHFLKDGVRILKFSKIASGKIFLFLVVFLPPVLIVKFYPAGFDHIISFGGVFVAVVLGLFPIAILWQQRKKLKDSQNGSSFVLPGGNIMLFVLALFFCYTIFVEIKAIM